MTARPGLRALCRTLFKHAAFTVGGGGVTMIALEREMVEEHRWLTQDQFRAIYGLARITPGTSILALVTGIAGDYALAAVACAAVLAICNGLSSAQLAAAHPVSGGTYEYGYKYIHPLAGYAAGWLFLVAKSASAATAARRTRRSSWNWVPCRVRVSAALDP